MKAMDKKISENGEIIEAAAESGVNAESAENKAETVETAENAKPETIAETEKPAKPSAKAKKAVHKTASAALLNLEDEEVDIRRQKTHVRRQIKTAKLSYETKKKLYGYGFISIWLIGIIWLFIFPLITSLQYSLSETAIVDKKTALTVGMTTAGIYLKPIGFQNYIDAFQKDRNFVPVLSESLLDILPKTIIILIFSMFIAVILNQKFRGRTLARAIFFLPVLIATGPVISVINGDLVAQQGVASAAQFSSLFKTDLVSELLTFLGISNISQTFANEMSDMASSVFNLIWNSGIQILIFLAALQNIPTSAKEAASMEGATAWEFFWKITFPYISPMILANLIYTVIDAFVDPDNKVMEIVLQQPENFRHGYGAALAWIYFAIIIAALAIVAGIVNKFVYYEVD